MTPISLFLPLHQQLYPPTYFRLPSTNPCVLLLHSYCTKHWQRCSGYLSLSINPWKPSKCFMLSINDFPLFPLIHPANPPTICNQVDFEDSQLKCSHLWQFLSPLGNLIPEDDPARMVSHIKQVMTHLNSGNADTTQYDHNHRNYPHCVQSTIQLPVLCCLWLHLLQCWLELDILGGWWLCIGLATNSHYQKGNLLSHWFFFLQTFYKK